MGGLGNILIASTIFVTTHLLLFLALFLLFLHGLVKLGFIYCNEPTSGLLRGYQKRQQ